MYGCVGTIGVWKKKGAGGLGSVVKEEEEEEEVKPESPIEKFS